MSEIRDSCAVVGIWGHPDLLYLAREALSHGNHRGQEGSGIALASRTDVLLQKGEGLVSEVFSERSSYWHALRAFKNPLLAIGHDRYSTKGDSKWINLQPVDAHGLVLCSNGDVVNLPGQKEFLRDRGVTFNTAVDAELIANSIYYHHEVKGRPWPEAIGKMMQYVRGVYSALLATPGTLRAFRDPYGIRPLFMGEDPIAFASETCMLDAIQSRVVREVNPGEMIEVGPGVITSHQVAEPLGPFLCDFEWIYFSRPDSYLNGIRLQVARKRAGAFMIEKYPAPDANVITCLPETAVDAAIGAAQACGVVQDRVFIKNRYGGRGFIHPNQSDRRDVARRKNNPIRENIEGRALVVFEDSIVRGTTTKELIEVLFNNGAEKIYLYVVSPPYSYPCFYGVDTGVPKDLLTQPWADLPVGVIERKVAEYLDGEGTTRLVVRYLRPNELPEAYGIDSRKCCGACFTGHYPIPIPEKIPHKREAEQD